MDQKYSAKLCQLIAKGSDWWWVEAVEDVTADRFSIPNYVPLQVPAKCKTKDVVVHVQKLIQIFNNELVWVVNQTSTWKKLFATAWPDAYAFLNTLSSKDFFNLILFASQSHSQLLEYTLMECIQQKFNALPNWVDDKPKLTFSS